MSSSGSGVLSVPFDFSLPLTQLARVHDTKRVDRILDRLHKCKGAIAQLGSEILLLGHAHAVLASAGATHLLRSVDNATHNLANVSDLGNIAHDNRCVKVAIANVSEH